MRDSLDRGFWLWPNPNTCRGTIVKVKGRAKAYEKKLSNKGKGISYEKND